MITDLILNDLIKLFSDEDLIRFVRRAEMRGILAAAEVLRLERKRRENQQEAGGVEQTSEPEIDPTRMSMPLCGIPVRARFSEGEYGSADLAHLSRESFFRWLRSGGGANLWAENTIAQLLGYEPQEY